MGVRITDKMVKELAAPARGNRITYDSEIKGFGLRVTAAGARSWVLNYRNADGRERRHTIGAYPEISVEAGRKKARELKAKIKLEKHDPRAERAAALSAPKMSDLCDYYIEHHLPEKRTAPAADDKAMIAKYIRPQLGGELVSAIDKAMLAKIHRSMSATPYRANRVMALMSTMFSIAVKDLGWRPSNPTQGVKRNQEAKRERYLNSHEMANLAQALADYEDQTVANIFRLLLLTGARRGEVLRAEWSQFNLDRTVMDRKTKREMAEPIWVKPSAMTKQNKVHRVPLSGDAMALLQGALAKAPRDDLGRLKSKFVFPGPKSGEPRTELKDEWRAIAMAAGIWAPHDKSENSKHCRIHDLRHTFASIVASDHGSLNEIGKLLGHTQPATTHRYAHLTDDPLRQAANRVAEIIAEAKPSDVVPFGERVA